MSAQERSNIITRVEETRWGKRKLLTQLQVPKSNYYRWRARALQGKQDSFTASTRIPWNKFSPPEEAAVLAAAREFRSGVAGNWPLGSPTTSGYRWVSRRCIAS